MNSLTDKPQIFFRFDYGGLIGRGHLSRCLSLADVFKSNGLGPILIIRKRPSIANDELPFKTIWLSEHPDVVSVNVESWRVGTSEDEAHELLKVIGNDATIVLDHYALDLAFQKIVRSTTVKIILIQDTTNKNFNADVLINYNLGAEESYEKVGSSASTKFLIGPKYAPLNLNYAKERSLRFNLETKVESVGIYLGGIESKNLEQVARAIAKIDYFKNKKIEWVVNTHEEKNILNTILNGATTEIHVRLSSLIDLYKRVQLFIGACGVSFLERACLGIWQFNFLVADNQKEIVNNIVKNQLGMILGDLRTITEDEIVNQIEKGLALSRAECVLQVKNVFNLIDGLGVSRMATESLQGINLYWSFRKVELSDSNTILAWRNNPEVYRYLFNPAPVELADHEKWISKLSDNQSVLFLMAEYKGQPSGTVRFDFNENFSVAEIGIYLAPQLHGKGLSSSMLSESEQIIKMKFSSLRKIIAKVLFENIASVKMFERSGYNKTATEETHVQLEKLLEN